MSPFVYHVRNNVTDLMQPGMTFTIEPMVTQGSAAHTVWDDGWSVVTQDGSLAAQYEHTILITNCGVEVLTI